MVVAILAILVGILVPALNSVRSTAKKTSSRATLETLSTAIETFKADQQVGGSYPPSESPSDNSGGLPHFQVRTPYATSKSGGIELTGAGMLVWALAGADLLGTPGFKTTRSGSATWAHDTDNSDGGDGNRGAYALDSAGEPYYARSGPYVDMTKVKVSRGVKVGGITRFLIDEEVQTRKDLGDANAETTALREYPMFLDAYGFPVLYWRADPAGQIITDKITTSSPPSPSSYKRGIYHFRSNWPLVSEKSPLAKPLILRPWDKNLHPTNPHYKLDVESTVNPTIQLNQPNFTLTGFSLYTLNLEVKAKASPQRPDTYLLVSPGEDGIYGTGDDITNFEHNGGLVSGK